MKTEEFLEKMKVLYPEFTFVVNDQNIKNKQKIEIICQKHGSFFRTVDKCLYKNIRCPECYYEKRKHDFLKTAHKVHGDFYDYSQGTYIADKKPIEIICPIHGSFWQCPNDHKKGYGCAKCSKKYKPTTDEWVASVKNLYDGKYDLSKVCYIDNKTPVTVICPEHGEFYPIPNNYRKGISGCPECNNVRKHEHFKKSTEEFVNDAKTVHGNKYDYSKVDYYNKSTAVLIICPTHGSFEQTPGTHLAGHGCPKCKNKSQTDFYNKLQAVFPNDKISYEKRLPWLGLMSFDMYFDDYNIAIEFDGIQHYEPVEHFGGVDYFKIIQERDARKDALCQENSCYLIRVPYNYTESDFKEIVTSIKRYVFKEMAAQDNREPEYVDN